MRKAIWAAVAAVGLNACTVPPPQGPSVMALPPSGKDFARFQSEDRFCQQTAAESLGLIDSQAAANQAALGSAALGTAAGAVAGALIGSASGNMGAGAAIGAGAGLLGGSAIGVGAAQNTRYGLQTRYDIVYSQCMSSYGNQVQAVQVPYAVPVAPYYGPSVGFSYGYTRPWGYRRW